MLGLKKKSIKLILEDKSIFYGYSFGAEKSISGEVVFNTGMVGYPEAMTDPSYKGQILCLTYPLIGNYGIPSDDKLRYMPKNFESNKIQVSGLIVSDYSKEYNHWQAKKSLDEWMQEHNVPGIYDIDTRELTKQLRKKGVMIGKIVYDKDVELFDPNSTNLVDSVSIKKPVEMGNGRKKIILLDCGCKNNIIRHFLRRGIKVKKVPYDYNFNKESYDGLFISNGPGDPKMCKETIEIIREALDKEKPIFGICLGSQLLALAAGADTYKLKYGHRSQNQPCLDLFSKRCYITTQNHGYAVRTKTLPKQWREWFINANDKTNEGILHKTKPFSAIQFHPENWPGPRDTEYLFDMFVGQLR